MVVYKDFVIQIGRDDGEGHRLQVIQSPAGRGDGTLRLPLAIRDARPVPGSRHLVPPKLEAVTAASGVDLSEDLCAAEDVTALDEERLGEDLFAALFSGQVGSLYERSLGEILGKQNHGLRIKLKIDPKAPGSGRLQLLPWELLRRAETRLFLSLSPLSPVVRYLDVPVSFPSLPLPPKLRVLAVLSGPGDLDELDAEREKKQLEELARSGGIDIRFLEQAQPDNLRRALIEEEFHVLHFIGHGRFDRESDQGLLFFVGPDGRSSPLSGEALAVKVRDASALRLTVLNACESGRSGKEGGNPFAGVANALVLAGMPAVVAMQVPISDAAAIAFSRAFYSQLAGGHPVDVALTEGRQAIHSAAPDGVEWSTPILISSLPENGLLFRLDSGNDGGSGTTWVETLRSLSPILAAPAAAILASGILLSFTRHTPPLFAQAPWLAAVIGLVVFLAVSRSGKAEAGWGTAPWRWRCRVGWLGGSLLLATGYMLLLRFTTVSPPGVWEAESRLQIGFHTATWSLTPRALSFLEQHPDLRSPEGLMLAFAIYGSGDTALVWHSWTISAAGFALIVTLCGSFLCFGWGCGDLARGWYGPVFSRSSPIGRASGSFFEH